MQSLQPVLKKTAKVLVTSANFSDYNFGIPNYESVVYCEMEKTSFEERFIDPFSLVTKNDPSIIPKESDQ